MDFEVLKIGKYNLVPYYDKTKKEWEQIRGSFPTKIGGSDCGVIMGKNPYATRASLFDEKLGMTPSADLSENQAVFWGNSFEDQILEASQYFDVDSSNDRNYLYNFSRGKKVNNHVAFDYTVWHDDVPWMAANVDGLNVKRTLNDQKIHHMIQMGELPVVKNITEMKTMSGQVYDKWASKLGNQVYKGLPPGYVYQVMLYMIVYSWMHKDYNPEFASLYSLVDGQKFNAYKILWDQDMADEILEETYKFHLLLVEGLERKNNSKDWAAAKKALDEIRPEPDDSVAYEKHLTENYLRKINLEEEMVGSEETEALRAEYLIRSEAAKEAENEKRFISNKIRDILVKNEVSRLSLTEGSIKYTSNGRLLIR